jgi:hypothetical protein
MAVSTAGQNRKRQPTTTTQQGKDKKINATNEHPREKKKSESSQTLLEDKVTSLQIRKHHSHREQ